VCLEDIKRWHDAHPQHDLVTVFLDKKQSWGSDTSGRAPVDLDDLINSKIGAANVYKPGELLAGHASLSAAALSNAWPTMGALQGKLLFILTGGALIPTAKYNGIAFYVTNRGKDAVLFACPDAGGMPDLFARTDVVCANFKYKNLAGTDLGRTASTLGFLSHVWDIPESDQGYRAAIEDFGSYIGIDDYTISNYNNGRMSGGYWCSGRPAWSTLATITSDGQARSGQKHRSSDNFTLNPPAHTLYLLWDATDASGILHPEIKYQLKQYNSVWWDSVVFQELTGSSISPSVSGSTLYLADPENTNGNSFTVTIKAVTVPQ
jgi:hypothetical protein